MGIRDCFGKFKKSGDFYLFRVIENLNSNKILQFIKFKIQFLNLSLSMLYLCTKLRFSP